MNLNQRKTNRLKTKKMVQMRTNQKEKKEPQKHWGRKQPAQEPLETIILEKTIIKIGGLLALGFGEAGAEIIGSNMKGGDSSVNAMLPGRRVLAVFGQCSMRDFAIVTEVCAPPPSW